MDQPFLMGVNVSWESQIEYRICHNDWVEVSELLDVIPSYLLSNGTIRISLDGLHPTSAVGYSTEFSKYNSYISSIEELDAVCLDIPDIKVIRFSAYNLCSTWVKALVDQRLARRLIFPKEYWEGTAEIVRLLARSGYITSTYEASSLNDFIEDSSDPNIVSGTVHPGAAQALHKVVVHNCAQYKLPNLLDLYLDHHKLALDDASLSVFQDAVVGLYCSLSFHLCINSILHCNRLGLIYICLFLVYQTSTLTYIICYSSVFSVESRRTWYVVQEVISVCTWCSILKYGLSLPD